MIEALAGRAKQHRLLAGISANLISELGRAVMLPVIAVVAARYLGANQYGIFATGQALVAFAATLAGFGLLHAILLLGSREEEPLSALLTNSIVGALATALVAFGGMALWLWSFSYSPETRTVVLVMGTALFAMAVNAQLTASLQVQGRYTLIAVAGVVAAVVNVAYALAVVVADLGLNALACTPLIASSTLMGTMAIGLRREFRLDVRYARVVGLFRTGFLFGLGDFFYFIYFSIDLVLLSLLSTERQVGLYNIPVRAMVVAYLLPVVVFNRVLYPRYFDWSRTDRDRLRRTYVLTTRGILLIGMFGAAVLIIVAEPLVPAVFGRSFGESATLLRILALALPLRYISSSASAVLATTDFIGQRVRIQAVTAALNVTLCLALIPVMDARGAAIATVITEAFLAVAQIAAVRRNVLDVDLVKELRPWLLVVPAVALVVGASGHQPQWAITLTGLVAIGSLALAVRPMELLRLAQATASVASAVEPSAR